MATVVKLFKTRKKQLQLAVTGHGIVAFHNGRFATTNPELEAEIEKLFKDPALLLYVDPEEETIDLDTQLNTVKLREHELRMYVYEQQIATQLADSSYGSGKSGIAGGAHTRSSPTTGGVSGTPRFSPEELRLAAAQIAEQSKQAEEAKKPAPVVTQTQSSATKPVTPTTSSQTK